MTPSEVTQARTIEKTLSLFNDESVEPRKEDLVPGAFILRSFALADEAAHLDALRHVTARSPFRNDELRVTGLDHG